MHSQVACTAPAPFACGSLLLLSEAMRDCPSLWTAILQPEEGDGLERFTDAPMPPSEDDEEEAEAPELLSRKRKASPAAAAVPASHGGSHAARGQSVGTVLSGGYDMAKRDPEWCGAERSCLWELSALAGHAHPSVAAMARALLAGTHVVYDGDPLRDLSLAAFLDRWLQKKPKAVRWAEKSAAAAANPDGDAAGDRMHPMARKVLAAGAQKDSMPQPWDGASFAALDEQDISPPDVFLHRYFTTRQSASAAAKKRRTADARRRRGDDDSADDTSDDDDDGGAAAEVNVDGLDFGSSSDDDVDLDAAMEDAEDEEHGPAAGGVSAHEAALAKAWAADRREAVSGASDSEDEDEDGDEEDEEREAPAFADAADFEHILAAGGMQPSEEDEEDDEEEDDLPAYDSDGQGWEDEELEEAPKPAKAAVRKGRSSAVHTKAKAGAKKTKPTRPAPQVTPQPSKRVRR